MSNGKKRKMPFLLKAPYLSFASPPDKNHSRTRRHMKNISVNLCPAWVVLADRASTASTDFPDYKRSTNVFHASGERANHTHTHPPPHPTAVTYHSSWHVSLRNSRRTGRGCCCGTRLHTLGSATSKGNLRDLKREDSHICSVTRAALG